jgi:hypothetical protein
VLGEDSLMAGDVSFLFCDQVLVWAVFAEFFTDFVEVFLDHVQFALDVFANVFVRPHAFNITQSR